MGADLKELHRRASLRFGELVRVVRPDQWSQPTPCREWDVRALVRHLTSESLWTPHILDGATIEEVGDRFEGDVLGTNPKRAYREAARQAVEAVARADLRRIVHLSYGDRPAEHYVFELTTDLLVHGWDLARAIGASDRMDPETVELCYRRLAPHEGALKATGLFGPKVEPPPGADLQTRLLALMGRVA